MKKLSIKSTLAAFFVIAFLFILYLGLATFKNMQQTHVQSERVAQSLHFLHRTEILFNQLQQYEAAQRGYMFTSKEAFAASYKASADSLHSAILLLQQQEQAYPLRAAQLRELTRLFEQKIRYSEATIANFDSGGVYAAANLINQGTGRLISDSIRYQLLASEEKDHAVLKNANQFLENLAKKTAGRLFVLAIVFLIILVVFLYVIWRHFQQVKQATEKLKYQASLIDTFPDAVFTTDSNFTILTWNQYAEELYGTSAAESIGKPMSSIFEVQLNEIERDADFSELVEKQYFKDEYSIKKKDGTIIYVLASVSSIVSSDGAVTGYMAVHRDITHRKKLETSQQQFNHELEKQVTIKTAETTNILERITDGFLALDSNFVFTFVNKKAGEILGFAPGVMIGKNIFADFPETVSSIFNNACLASYQMQQYLDRK
jgi:PAS domain S-box-containing protein